MSTVQAFRRSLRLLNKRDRRIFALVTLAQMSTAFLDLAGVLLLGVLTTVLVSSSTGAPLPSVVSDGLARFGLTSVDTSRAAIWLALTAGLLLVTKSIASVFLTLKSLRFLATRQAAVAGELVGSLLSKPLLQVRRRSSQQTAYALMGGLQAATLIILGQGSVVASEVVLLAVMTAGLLLVSPLVTLFTVVFFASIAFVLHRLLSGWVGALGLDSGALDVESYESLFEALHSYREIVVSNRRSYYADKFASLRWRASAVQADLQIVGLMPKYVFEVALVFGGGLLAVSQLASKSLSTALGIIVVFLVAGSRIVPSILRLQTAALSVRSASGQAQNTFELADELEQLPSARGPIEPSQVQAIRDARAESSFEPSITVSDVSVSYPDSQSPALENVSVHVDSGTSLALVGTTGAGKSTLADAILGVLAVDNGSVTIGGYRPADAIALWPGEIAYVPQDVAMSNGTVRANVALGLPASLVSDEDVWAALERARLADFLREARDGLDTLVGEHGVKLSGGQRQRLGIARALYTRPSLLILDEATSALDAETEQAVAATLRELHGDVTTVTIAHRLTTIRNHDQVLYLEDGRVVAQGTFDEVRAQSPRFDQQARLHGL